jgi:hypothetical protein
LFFLNSGEASASNSDTEKKSDEEKTKKRKRSTSKHEVDDDSSNQEKPDAPTQGSDAEEEVEAGSDGESRQPKKRTKERARSGGSEITSGTSDLDNEDDEKQGNGETEEKKKIKKPLLPIPGETKKKITMDEEDELPQLHRTASIFLRNLSPLITKTEVEAMCVKYPGFMRAAIADPQPEKKFFRRAWVTFKRSVNIKGIISKNTTKQYKLNFNFLFVFQKFAGT